ncbi:MULTISPECIES: DUF2933 domain-containing protein [Hyphomicrobiales]|jgi:hypothetical protein|uniref:DUF2933 family protein n=2 Tax=Rhizobium/Agrobacterium group TaxID=227290 RepID=A0A285U467_9HYPH|nr:MULTISPECIES: DUF2933 domain-containing protein [Hyphomicrobiales]KAB2722526.1 DUF2933 domain-containing protein [Brucella intermedia]CAD6630767.1 hypothetical protein RFYW14_04347 [Pseudorhizobium flavum]SOC36730.1 hypothetical protein SAMN05892877_10368 [Rhizobium subbaraonis]
METNRDQLHKDENPGRRFSAANIALYGFLAIAGFYLLTEHRAHLLGWLPWLLILACPLLHVFMHGKHGGHSGHGGGGDRSSARQQSPHQH